PGEEVLRVEERVVLDADAGLARRRLPAPGRRRRPAEPAGAIRLAGSSDPAGRRAGAVALLTDLDDVVPAARRWTGAPWLAEARAEGTVGAVAVLPDLLHATAETPYQGDHAARQLYPTPPAAR